MHDAFRVVNILDKLPLKIESITHHGHKLLVGTSEGALLEYEIRDSGNGAFSIHLLNTRKSFSKRPIEQLQAIEAIGILLCLTGYFFSFSFSFSLFFQNFYLDFNEGFFFHQINK